MKQANKLIEIIATSLGLAAMLGILGTVSLAFIPTIWISQHSWFVVVLIADIALSLVGLIGIATFSAYGRKTLRDIIELISLAK
jgi:hypothetical protein